MIKVTNLTIMTSRYRYVNACAVSHKGLVTVSTWFWLSDAQTTVQQFYAQILEAWLSG